MRSYGSTCWFHLNESLCLLYVLLEKNAEESTSTIAEDTTPETQVNEEELAGLAVVETE